MHVCLFLQDGEVLLDLEGQLLQHLHHQAGDGAHTGDDRQVGVRRTPLCVERGGHQGSVGVIRVWQPTEQYLVLQGPSVSG